MGGSPSSCKFTFNPEQPFDSQSPKKGPGSGFQSMANDPSTGFASAGGLSGAVGKPLPARSRGRTGQSVTGISTAGPVASLATGVVSGVSHLFGGGGNTTQEDLRILNSVVANTTINVSTQCENSTSVSQYQDLNCDAAIIGGRNLTDTSVCLFANDILTRITENRLKLEQDAAVIEGRPAPSDALEPDAATQALIGNALANPVSYVCEGCVYNAISQEANVNISTNCSASTNIHNELRNSMNAAIQQMLTNKEDFLGQIGGILGKGNRDCVGSDLANKLNTSVTANEFQKLYQNMSVSQSIEISEGSRSVFLSGFNQSITANSAASLVSNLGVTNNLYNRDQVNASQTLYHSNDTIGDLASALSNAIVGTSRIFDNIVTQLLIIVAALCGVLLIAFGLIALTDKNKAKDILGLNSESRTQYST